MEEGKEGKQFVNKGEKRIRGRYCMRRRRKSNEVHDLQLSLRTVGSRGRGGGGEGRREGTRGGLLGNNCDK